MAADRQRAGQRASLRQAAGSSARRKAMVRQMPGVRTHRPSAKQRAMPRQEASKVVPWVMEPGSCRRPAQDPSPDPRNPRARTSFPKYRLALPAARAVAHQTDWLAAVLQTDWPVAVLQTNWPVAVLQTDSQVAALQMDWPAAVLQADSQVAALQMDWPAAVLQMDWQPPPAAERAEKRKDWLQQARLLKEAATALWPQNPPAKARPEASQRAVSAATNPPDARPPSAAMNRHPQTANRRQPERKDCHSELVVQTRPALAVQNHPALAVQNHPVAAVQNHPAVAYRPGARQRGSSAAREARQQRDWKTWGEGKRRWQAAQPSGHPGSRPSWPPVCSAAAAPCAGPAARSALEKAQGTRGTLQTQAPRACRWPVLPPAPGAKWSPADRVPRRRLGRSQAAAWAGCPPPSATHLQPGQRVRKAIRPVYLPAAPACLPPGRGP